MDLKSVKSDTVQLANEVGEFIRREMKAFDRNSIEYKGLNDLVSYVDKTSEKMLVQSLGEIIPDSGILGEEGTYIDLEKEYKWVIDPLDGTTNFIHGLPVFAISIGLYRNNEPILGVIYEINREEMFVAIEGEKAYCNGSEIRVSTATELGESLLATGFPFRNFENSEDYLNIFREFMRKTHGIRRMGSAAVDLAYVACGRFEGFFEYNLNPWDVAAGIFIVQQAGGTVTDFYGGNTMHDGKSLIAACGIHDKMLEEIKKHWN